VLRQEVLDAALLDAVASVLDARVIRAAVDEAFARLGAGQHTQHERRSQIERELPMIEVRQSRLTEAVARGEGGVDALLLQLRTEEERRRALASELAGLASLDQVASLDAGRIKNDLVGRARKVREQLGRHTPQSRVLLRQIVTDRIDCEPFREGNQVGYRFTVRASFGGLLTGSTDDISTSDGVPDGTLTLLVSL
jgi:hypothetical protein